MRTLITGGTGTLGKALVKRVLDQGGTPIVYSRDEGKQALSFNDSRVIKIIGDVRDFDKLNTSIFNHKPDVVIHTAALKRVDDMEMYPDECIKTNIQGSDNVAKASLKNNVGKCILISTDKACQPVNVYGSSKFIAERLFTNHDFYSKDTIFASVRYGNVICSRGSFIPLWMDLINSGTEIKVTSTEMTRFLFTIEDAVDTVLNSIDVCQGGEVFVPKINSYTLPDCIKALELITGKSSSSKVVGLRPGEKLHEDMLAKTELPFAYEVDGVNLLQIRPQYTNKSYQDFKKYNGPHFNSKLWVKDDVEKLKNLILNGLSQ